MESLLLFLCIASFLLLVYNSLKLFTNPAEKRSTPESPPAQPVAGVSSKDIVFSGRQARIKAGKIQELLSKHLPYYQQLDKEHQQIFIRRLQAFMAAKTFVIKDDKVFTDMPVLASATAVQLTFGLREFLLPYYRYIRIYPTEYIATDRFRILAGNVQGPVITVAWNHFMHGLADHKDGANLGLHEMSHALYYQKIVVDRIYKDDFNRRYENLISYCKLANDIEAAGHKDLYSPYANTDLQEFWAETVELFFEKPAALEEHYPEVFAATCALLNQNPHLPARPVIDDQSTLEDRLKKLFRRPVMPRP